VKIEQSDSAAPAAAAAETSVDVAEHGEGDAPADVKPEETEPMEQDISDSIAATTTEAASDSVSSKPDAEPETTTAAAISTDSPVSEAQDSSSAAVAEEPKMDAAVESTTIEAKETLPMEAEESKETPSEADVKPEEAKTEVEPAKTVFQAPVSQATPQQTKKPKVDTAVSTRVYLDQSVVPILLQGLSWLAKTRPEDPIQSLANYLIEHKVEFEGQDSGVNGNQ
jgi:hypothetical protein